MVKDNSVALRVEQKTFYLLIKVKRVRAQIQQAKATGLKIWKKENLGWCDTGERKRERIKKARVRLQGCHTCTGFVPTRRPKLQFALFSFFFFFFLFALIQAKTGRFGPIPVEMGAKTAESVQFQLKEPSKQTKIGSWPPFFCFMWPCEKIKKIKKNKGRRKKKIRRHKKKKKKNGWKKNKCVEQKNIN